jgi:hypothetical protein
VFDHLRASNLPGIGKLVASTLPVIPAKAGIHVDPAST